MKHTLIIPLFLFVFGLYHLAEAAPQKEYDFFRDTNFTESSPTKWSFPPLEIKTYKELRLEEMAALWKGTVLEPHTVPLLSMLLQENGILNAERRHDCHNVSHNGRRLKGCTSVGIMGHNICKRGTPLIYGSPKKYCYDYAMTDFERDYPDFAFDWREQFREYTLRMTQLIEAGYTSAEAIKSWNSREVGRVSKVKRHYNIVMTALDLL